MRDYDDSEESLYVHYLDISNFHSWAMSQKPPVYNFEWIKDFSQFNEDLLKKL